MGSHSKGKFNKYGQPHSQEHKPQRMRKSAEQGRTDATHGISLVHPQGQGYWEISGIAGTAGNYALSSGHTLSPDAFEPGQKFGFGLSLPLSTLDVEPEGMILGWAVFVEAIEETE